MQYFFALALLICSIKSCNSTYSSRQTTHDRIIKPHTILSLSLSLLLQGHASSPFIRMGFSMYMQQHSHFPWSWLASACAIFVIPFFACLPRLPRSTPAHIICKVYLMGPGHVSTSMRGVKRECVQHETLAELRMRKMARLFKYPMLLKNLEILLFISCIAFFRFSQTITVIYAIDSNISIGLSV